MYVKALNISKVISTSLEEEMLVVWDGLYLGEIRWTSFLRYLKKVHKSRQVHKGDSSQQQQEQSQQPTTLPFNLFRAELRNSDL